MNAVDYEGNYLFYVFGKSHSNAKIRSYARELMRSPNIPEFFEVKNVKLHPKGPYTPNFVYVTTKQYKKERKIRVYYDSFPDASTRVFGSFLYKTVAEWEMYIISKYTPSIIGFRDKLIKLTKMSNDDYDVFSYALGEASANHSIGGLVEKYSYIEFALDIIKEYRSATDKYILRCLENIKKTEG